MSKSRCAFLVLLVLLFSGGFYFSVGGWAQGYNYNIDEVVDLYGTYTVNFTIAGGGTARLSFRCVQGGPIDYHTIFNSSGTPIDSLHRLNFFDDWKVYNPETSPVNYSLFFYNPGFGQAHITGFVTDDFFTVNSEIIIVVAVVVVILIAIGVGAFIVYKRLPAPKEKPVEVERVEEESPGVEWVKCSYCGTRYEATRVKCPNCGAYNKQRRK